MTWSLPGARKKGKWELCLSDLEYEKSSDMDGGDGCIIWMFLIPLNYTYKNRSVGKFYAMCIYQWKNMETK